MRAQRKSPVCNPCAVANQRVPASLTLSLTVGEGSHEPAVFIFVEFAEGNRTGHRDTKGVES